MSLGAKVTVITPRNSIGSGNAQTAGNTVAIGSLVVAQLTGWGAANGSFTNFVDSAGNSYFRLASSIVSGFFSCEIWVCYGTTATITTGITTLTPSFTGMGSACAMAVYAWALNGFTASADIAVSKSGTASNTSLATGTLAQPNELIVTSFSSSVAIGSWTEGAGFTQNAYFGNGGYEWAFQIISGSTASVTYAPSWVSSGAYNLAVGTIQLVTPTINITLSGQSITSSQGAIKGSASLAIAGQPITSSQGSLVAYASFSLSGQLTTSSIGAITTTCISNITLNGQVISSSIGILSPAISTSLVELSSQSITSGQGSLSPNASAGLAGLRTTSGQGSLTPAPSIALTGQGGTIGQGSFQPASTVAMVGSGLASGQGNLAPVFAFTLPGQSIVSSVGNIAVIITLALAGQRIIGNIGKLFVPFASSIERTWKIVSENRLLTILANNRNLSITPENRELVIGVEDRSKGIS